jgi:hypothetical protein
MTIRIGLGVVAVSVYIGATIVALTVINDRSLAGWVALGGLLMWPVVGALLFR